LIYELVYTSYKKGLDPKTSGFTTVARTESMPVRYIRLCESLSGYQFVYSLDTPLYEQNPVAYSHYRYQEEGREISILSRVCAVKKDYTHRENLLAHHVIINEKDRVPGGLAWIMDQKNFFFEKWDETPRRLPKGRIQLPPDGKTSAKAEKWEAIFGDGGAAGVLAQSAIDTHTIPAFIIFKPQTLMLPLIIEALCLLPPEKQWNVSFNTYFTRKPIHMDCLWRCCLHDSKALLECKKFPGALILDISNRLINRNIPDDDKRIMKARGQELDVPSPFSEKTDTSGPAEVTAKIEKDLQSARDIQTAGPKDDTQNEKPRLRLKGKKIFLWLSVSAALLFILLISLFNVSHHFFNKKDPHHKIEEKNVSQQEILRQPVSPQLNTNDFNSNIQNFPTVSARAFEKTKHPITEDGNTDNAYTTTNNISVIQPPNDTVQFVVYNEHEPVLTDADDLDDLSGRVFDDAGNDFVFNAKKDEGLLPGENICIVHMYLLNGKPFGKISCDDLTMSLDGYFSERLFDTNDYGYSAVFFSNPPKLIWITPLKLTSDMIRSSNNPYPYTIQIDLNRIKSDLFQIFFSVVPEISLTGSIAHLEKNQHFPLSYLRGDENQIHLKMTDDGKEIEHMKQRFKTRLEVIETYFQSLESKPDTKNEPVEPNEQRDDLIDNINESNILEENIDKHTLFTERIQEKLKHQYEVLQAANQEILKLSDFFESKTSFPSEKYRLTIGCEQNGALMDLFISKP
jgi:hypothetical protein